MVFDRGAPAGPRLAMRPAINLICGALLRFFLLSGALLVPLLQGSSPSAAQSAALPGEVTDHFFLSTDGVRLHYLEAGPPAAHTLVFIPGWTMPAWIWMPQILAFSRSYHVVAFDPRGQGDSEAHLTGYEPVG